jgi:TRAP-type C4-dicarboxylate transport system permease small subunit
MRTLPTIVRRVTIAAGSLILCLMLVQVVVDVFLRAFAGTGFPATPDIVAKYYMVAISFLPLAFTEVQRRHIEASFFTDFLPGAAKQAVFLLGFVVSLAVYGALVYGTTLEAISQTSRGAYVMTGVMQFLTWPSYWILPVSFALMALVLVMRVAEVLTGRFDDSEHDPLEQLEPHRESR